MPLTTEPHELGDAPFRVGDWLVEPQLNRLSRGHTFIQIELKMMDVLVCLAARPGDLVTRREIIDTVWTIEFISEGTLTRIVAQLRRALGDDARQPRYIETIHSKGYRLIAPIEADRRTTATVAHFPARGGEETRDPYPGLAAFTEADTEFFFGRESEVAGLWRKITSRRLLAVIGPSGVGKTSFLRAGLIPGAPEGWGTLICQPGEAPYSALARVLAPQFEGDAEAISKLVDISDETTAVAVVSRWREHHDQVLLIIDQFEELFTLNPPEVQARLAAFIGSLAHHADIHVLLSMRDDFLYRCHEHAGLSPIFSGLIPVKVPVADDLRRALVQPAARYGFSFEDEALADEMLDAVAGERGALPLVAFAVARLWDERDSERKLLTRQAYGDIGGVAGALAHHAEATIDRIGSNRIAIVRELFHNLVTAEGTRAVREWDELLSIFSDSQGESPSESPEEVLRELIDARLLTSYDVREEDREATRRVEIIHESLLANWPRLVGWHTQDADSARLRDELRQATRTWDEHNRSDDLLWTGSAYREFAVWRERYPGGLSETEESFASAMTSHAKRRKRRRRMVAAAALMVAVVLAGVFGALWRQSERLARRAEAANLHSRAQLELDSYPSATVAYATASLELSDSPEARRLALDALWKGPTAFVVNEDPCLYPAEFSPDGRWLVQPIGHNLRMIGAEGSSSLFDLVNGDDVSYGISSGGDIICSFDYGGVDGVSRVVLWSAPDARQITEVRYEYPAWPAHVSCSDQRAVFLVVGGKVGAIDAIYPDASSERLGTLDFEFQETADLIRLTAIDVRTGRWLGAAVDDEVFVFEIDDHSLTEPRSLGRHGSPITRMAFHPMGRVLATTDADGRIRLWDPVGRSPARSIQGPKGASIRFTHDGSLLEAYSVDSDQLVESWVWSLAPKEPRLVRRVNLGKNGERLWRWDAPRLRVAKCGPDQKTRIWPAGVPADADPLELLRGKFGAVWSPSFQPEGRWIATTSNTGLVMWPLARSFASIIRRHEYVVYGLEFGPEGVWLASSSVDGSVRLWPLEGDVPAQGRVLLEPSKMGKLDLAVSPAGDQILVGAAGSGAQLVPLDGAPPRVLPGFDRQTWGVAFSHGGRLAAAAGGEWEPQERVIRVWDVASGEEVAFLGPDENLRPFNLVFTDDSHLLSGSNNGLVKWDLETGRSEVVYEGVVLFFAASADRQSVLVVDQPDTDFSSGGRAVLINLETGATTRLETHGDRVSDVALGPSGDIAVTSDLDGVIRVGLATGEEPHLLLGHEQVVTALAVDPLGRWVASASVDTTVRLWPMPDLDKPPLHTLPHAELIAKLNTLTNLRVVRDEDSPTGWKLEVGPFLGWETVPSW